MTNITCTKVGGLFIPILKKKVTKNGKTESIGVTIVTSMLNCFMDTPYLSALFLFIKLFCDVEELKNTENNSDKAVNLKQ